MAAPGREKKLDLFVQVPAAGRQFLHTVDVAISSSRNYGNQASTQPTYRDVADAILREDLLPPESCFSFLREDGVSEVRMTEKVPGKEAILNLTRAPEVPPPRLSPIIVGSHPRAHAPSVCQSIRSGAELKIPVQAATGTSIECIMPRQKALDLGLHCLLENAIDGFDYFGLVKCKIPGYMMLHSSRPHEGLESLLHVYCSKRHSSDTPFFNNTLIIGAPGFTKMKMCISFGTRFNSNHPQPCPYQCCHTFDDEVQKLCASCGTVKEGMKRCSCKAAYYCDEVCQRQDWRARHKLVCGVRQRPSQ